MSYSFNVQGADKGEVLLKAAEEFKKVVEQQPVHAADHEQAYAAVSGMVDALTEDPSQDIYVSCSGYVSWVNGPDDRKIATVSLSVTATLVRR